MQCSSQCFLGRTDATQAQAFGLSQTLFSALIPFVTFCIIIHLKNQIHLSNSHHSEPDRVLMWVSVVELSCSFGGWWWWSSVCRIAKVIRNSLSGVRDEALCRPKRSEGLRVMIIFCCFLWPSRRKCSALLHIHYTGTCSYHTGKKKSKSVLKGWDEYLSH